MDLTQATLKEWALKNGLDANIDAMSQAEKAMLRYQYVMSNSSVVMDDFSRTADTYHNLLVRIKENFKALGATVGGALINAFKPVLRWINAAIQAVNQFAIVVSNALGKIFGWKYELAEGGQEISGLADGYDDVADAAGGATKAAKELNKQLQGFDELNNLTTNDDNGGGGGSGGSGGGGASGASAKAGQWVEVEKDFMSDIDTLGELGKYISGSITDSLNNINWDEIKAKVSDFSKGLAEFLNGLVSPEMFGAIGKTISEGLNTAFLAVGTFAEEFDWSNLGNSVATGITTAISTFDAEKAGSAMHNLMSGVLEALTIAVDKTDWYQLGVKIGDYLEKLDIPDLAIKLAKLAGKIAQGLLDALKGFWENTDWQGKMGLVILGLIKVAKLTGLGGVLSGLIGKNLPSSLNIGKTIQLAGITVAAAVTWKVGSYVGTSLGKAIASYLGDDEMAAAYKAWADLSFPEKLFEIKTAIEYTWEEIEESGVDTGLKEAGKTVVDKLGGLPQTIWYGFKEMLGLNNHDAQGSTTHTSENGVEHGGSGGKFGNTGSSTHLSSNNVLHGGSSGKFNTYQTGYSVYEQFDKYGKQNTIPNPNLDTTNNSTNIFKGLTDKVEGIKQATEKLTGENDTQMQGGASGPGYGAMSNRLKLDLSQLEIPGAAKTNSIINTLNKSLSKLNTEGSKNTQIFSKNASKSMSTVKTSETSLNTTTKTLTAKLASLFSGVDTKVSKSTKNISDNVSTNLSKASSDTNNYLPKMTNTINTEFGKMNTTVETKTGESGMLGKVKSSFGSIASAVVEKLGSNGGVEATVVDKFKAMFTAVDKYSGDTPNGMLGKLKSNLISMNTETGNKLGESGMLGTVRLDFGTMKSTVETTKADAQFGVDEKKTPDDVKTDYGKLTAEWKDYSNRFDTDFKDENGGNLGDKINAGFKAIKKLWPNYTNRFDTEFEDSKKTPLGEKIHKGFENLKKLWPNYSNRFDTEFVDSHRTPLGEKVAAGFKALTDIWHNHTATFGLDFTADASSTQTVLDKVSEAVGNAFSKVTLFARIASSVKSMIRGYATGGVFDKPTLGVFGEAGAEAIVPLEKNLGWAKNVAELITNRMSVPYNASPVYNNTSYAGNSYVTYNSSGYSTDNSSAIAEQNALLREQNALLQRIAAKDVSISSKDVFNAVRSENRDYMNRTGNSPFIS